MADSKRDGGKNEFLQNARDSTISFPYSLETYFLNINNFPEKSIARVELLHCLSIDKQAVA